MHLVRLSPVAGRLARPIRRSFALAAAARRPRWLLGAILALAAVAGHGQAPTYTGRILLEQWTDVPGTTIAALTNPATNPDYPAHPAHRDYPTSLELVSTAAANQGDDYGTRFRGYVHPPADGNYTFWVAGDDQAELWLSPDDNPTHAVRIAHTASTNSREWSRYPTQQSAAKRLLAGRKYYLEVLHKQGALGSHVAVGWQLPTGTLERPIGGHRLSPIQLAHDIPAAGTALANLATGHPRILASALTFNRVKERIAVANSASARSYAALKSAADDLIARPPVAAGGDAVKTTREVYRRVQLLAFVYRISRDRQYLDRAWDELNNLIGNAAPAWREWNPRNQIIDVAELTKAAAIGYDWLYDDLTLGQRNALRGAILTKAFRNEALIQYPARFGYKWPRESYNFNAVSNSGFTLGALAVARLDEPTADDTEANAIVHRVLNYALPSLVIGVSDFAPDGGWDEGPGYWSYTTTHLANLFATTEVALGSSFGLADKPGLAQTGLYVPYINRPTTDPDGLTFNHADGDNNLAPGPQLLWMANRYNQPLYATLRNKALHNHTDNSQHLDVQDLLWYNRHYRDTDLSNLPLDRVFRSSEVAMLRSGWDHNAVFVGLKAGNNQAGHEQLDIGTFVLDAMGRQFAEELGNDKYTLKNYFEIRKPTGTNAWPATPYRYDYYRIRAEGQNTLLVNPPASTDRLEDQQLDQTQTLEAPITTFASSPNDAFAIADIQPAYRNDLTSAQRGVRLFGPTRRPTPPVLSNVLIQDELVAPRNVTVHWQMHTRARIEVRDQGKSVLLTRYSKGMWLHIVEGPASAVFDTAPAKLLVDNDAVTSASNQQDPTTGLTKLVVKLNGVRNVRLAILAVPLPDPSNVPNANTYPYPTITPLHEWGDDPLPVELTEFTARAAPGGGADLAWRTASEQASAWFVVERALDEAGTRFRPIGRVAAQGTSTQPVAYRFHDAAPCPAGPGSTRYYRLRQLDTDSTAHFSPVRTLACAPGASPAVLVAYPNPTAGSFMLPDAPAGTLTVTDLCGRVVRRLALPGGPPPTAVDLHTAPAGTYLLRLQLADGTQLTGKVQRE